jgi:hypothetical protein
LAHIDAKESGNEFAVTNSGPSTATNVKIIAAINSINPIWAKDIYSITRINLSPTYTGPRNSDRKKARNKIY